MPRASVPAVGCLGGSQAGPELQTLAGWVGEMGKGREGWALDSGVCGPGAAAEVGLAAWPVVWVFPFQAPLIPVADSVTLHDAKLHSGQVLVGTQSYYPLTSSISAFPPLLPLGLLTGPVPAQPLRLAIQ